MSDSTPCGKAEAWPVNWTLHGLPVRGSFVVRDPDCTVASALPRYPTEEEAERRANLPVIEDQLRRARSTAVEYSTWDREVGGEPNDFVRGMMHAARRILAEIDGEGGE
ncbi:MAG: hypothetical protein AAF196_09070 [Planctomycetota bacterium]